MNQHLLCMATCGEIVAADESAETTIAKDQVTCFTCRTFATDRFRLSLIQRDLLDFLISDFEILLKLLVERIDNRNPRLALGNRVQLSLRVAL